MKLSLRIDKLSQYVITQIKHFFPDGQKCQEVSRYMRETLERMDYCFSAVYNKYFRVDSQTHFNHLNSDQYSMFLYFLSNTLYKKEENIHTCEKIFYLNKLLNGVDVFFTIKLPDIFLFSHPVGTVLGRAKYDNYFFVSQNCTIGSNHKVDYPVLGKYVAVYEGASVLGKCTIGDNCKISAKSLIMDRDLKSNHIYIGVPHNYIIKQCKRHDKIWDSKK